MDTTTSQTLLVLTSTLPRWAGDTEPRFVEDLSYQLADKFDVVVLAPHCPGAARHETYSDGKRSITVHRFRYCLVALQSLAYDGGVLSKLKRNPLRLLLVPLFLAAQTISIAKLHRRHRFAAIHAHWIIPQGMSAALFRLLARQAPPLLITSHGGDLFALRGALLARLKRWVLGKATRISVVSDAMRSAAVELGCNDNDIAVRSMGVDLRFTFTPGEAGTVRNGLIFVGRLVEKKGLAYLIEAMAVLVARHRELRLTIIGDGPLREPLTQLVSKLDLQDHVHFAGSLPNAELPGYLRAAQIAVMPSVIAPSGDQEGLGLVAVEAMGCGCAVVASDLPAVRDVVIDGETGLMVRPADSAELAEKIGRLLADDTLRDTLAAAGRRHALARFDWREVGTTYAELIAGMLQTPPRNESASV